MTEPATGPAEPGDEPEQRVPGLGRERTALAWTRTAISFAALGGVVLEANVVTDLPVPPNSLVYTSFAAHYLPTGATGFVAAVLGGLDSPPGAVIGGLVIGLALSYVSGYEGSALAPLAAFVILIVVLLLRPTGLFSATRERRV